MGYALYPEELKPGIYKRFSNSGRRCVICNQLISDTDEMDFFVRQIGRFRQYCFIHSRCIFNFTPSSIKELTEDEEE